jgi:hypothetical protein
MQEFSIRRMLSCVRIYVVGHIKMPQTTVRKSPSELMDLEPMTLIPMREAKRCTSTAEYGETVSNGRN